MIEFYDFPRHPGQFAGNIPVAADTVIDSGALTAVNADGNALNAASTVTGFVAGRCQGGADNAGGDAGDEHALIERGVFELGQADSNPVTKAHIGKMVFAITPDSVAHTGTCRAGILLGFSTSNLPIVDTTMASLSTAADIAAAIAAI